MVSCLKIIFTMARVNLMVEQYIGRSLPPMDTFAEEIQEVNQRAGGSFKGPPGRSSHPFLVSHGLLGHGV